MKKRILISIFLLILFSKNHPSEAQTFSKISFKDKESDWIEILLEKKLEKEIEIRDDSLIKKISPGDLSEEKKIIIHFKANSEKTESKNGIFHIYIRKSGLTGTTEQLYIKADEEIVDTACWKNSSPSESEKKDMEELQIPCLNSEKVESNEIIEKIDGTWKIISENTDGDLSEEIRINEVFPNPKGKDTNKEWIELYNASEKDINLGNWSINGEKLTNKSIIGAKNYLIVNLSLKNENEIVQISDFQNNIISEIRYKRSEEDLSYSLCRIKKGKMEKESWLWTDPTKNSSNPLFQELQGKVIRTPTIEKQYFFIIELADGRQKKIFIDEKKHNFLLLQSLLKENTEISVLISEKNFMEDFGTKNPPPEENPDSKNSENWLYYMAGTILLMLIILISIL